MHKVKIIWGSEATREENPEVSEYEFDTERELEAFMTGVEAGVGWMDYEVVEATPPRGGFQD